MKPLAPQCTQGPPALRLRRSALALAALVVAWALLRLLEAPALSAPRTDPGAGSARGGSVLPLAQRPSAAATGTAKVPLRSDDAPRFSAELPLDRGPDLPSWWDWLRWGCLASLLAVGAALVLRVRAGAPQARPSRWPWRGGWQRWLAPGGSGPPLQVLRSARLTPRASVHVVRWDDREWLIGCAEHGMTLLAERPSARQPCAEPSGAAAARPPAPMASAGAAPAEEKR